MFKFFYYLLIAFFLVSCESDPYDLVIQNGIIYDGSGSESESVDIGIIGNQIIKLRHSFRSIILYQTSIII